MTRGKNRAFYHWRVTQWEDSKRLKKIEERLYYTQKEIMEAHGLSRSAIYFLLNPNPRRYNPTRSAALTLDCEAVKVAALRTEQIAPDLLLCEAALQ